MLITLPFQSAFVIDVGVSVRLSYIFGALALAAGFAFGGLRRLSHPALYWLGAFALVAVGSIILTPLAPVVSYAQTSGLRGVYGLRPVMQCVQLALMAGCMAITWSFCRDLLRLRLAMALILAGGLFALAYGAYGFVALLTGSKYVEINNAMNSDFGYGYKEQGNSYAGGYIPRPRSTFIEPLNFGNFLILVIGLSALQWQRARARRHVARFAWAAVLGVAIMLFLVGVNSRGAMYGSVAAAMSLIVFVTRPRQLFRASRTVLAWMVCLAILGGVFVQVRYKGGLPVFASYFASRFSEAVQGGNRVQQDWVQMKPLVERHLLFGVGFGNLPFYWGELEGSMPRGITEAGGLYLRLVAEVGIVGTLLYLGFIAAVLWGLLRAGRRRATLPELRWCAATLFFIIAADAVQRVALVGLATDTHLWVEYGLAIVITKLAREAGDPIPPAALSPA